MRTEIFELLDGARKARGTAVIIDVFRAFSLEPFVLAQNAASLTAVGKIETAFEIKARQPETVLIGERHGKKIDGFDFGNSPASVNGVDFSGKHAVHTTSAGTQGLAAAVHADRLYAASLVNAAATAKVIAAENPDCVSLVCMGWEGKKNTEEDLLCAQYIRSLLEGHPIPDIRRRAEELKYYEGKKFFDPAQAEVFPEPDFWLCVDPDRFDFAIEAVPCDNGFRMKAVRP